MYYTSGPIILTTGLNLEKKLMDAALKPDEKEIKRLIEEERIPITSKDVFKQTAAHVAAANGNLPVLQYLLGREPSLLSALDGEKQTPLHQAIVKGALETVEYLVDHCNADIFQRGGLRTGNNALHLAAEAGQLTTLRYLIEKKSMNPNERNSRGQTAVLLAARDDYFDIVQYLAENTNANLTAVDDEARNILFMAASSFNGSLRVPKYVLDQKNMTIDVDWRDYRGETVTHFACRFFHFDTIKYYVDEKGANINIADTENRTALHRASKLGNLKLVDYLLDHGADPTVKDVFGRTPLDTKADRVVADPRILARLDDEAKLRTRRSLAEPLSKSYTSSLRRPQAPLVLADGREVSLKFADSDGNARARLMAGESSPANDLLLLANAFFRPSKRQTPLMGEEVVNSRVDSIAVDVIHSDSFS